MERRKLLPPGTLLYLPHLPLKTTVADVVDVFDRAGICLTPDRVEIRPLEHFPDHVAANISLRNADVAKIVQACFSRHGITLDDQKYSRRGWRIKVAAFGSTKEVKTYDPLPAPAKTLEHAWPPHNVERRG
jgi:hypothetical protein